MNLKQRDEELLKENTSLFSLNFFHGLYLFRLMLLEGVLFVLYEKKDQKFYTNASESVNNILKQKVNRKEQPLPDFVDQMFELHCICDI